MKTLRTCDNAQLNTGVSKCPPDFEKMKGAILVEPGHKLPKDLTGDQLEELCHADRPDRAYGIVVFAEYAKNGGEVQTSANGYLGERVTGVSARKDTFTLDKYHPSLVASLNRTYTNKWGAYFFDANFMLHGIDDGTDTLAPFPMNSVYADTTPMPTSSESATMTVTFCHEDARKAMVDYNYVVLPFNPENFVLGLTPVVLEAVEAGGNDYKLYEKLGQYDLTPIYGPQIADAGVTCIAGTASAVTYDETKKVLTIASTEGGKVGAVRLKAPSVLYTQDIKGIEQI